MYNFYLKNCLRPIFLGRMRKLLLVMKLTTLILITVILHVSATTLAQKVTLKATNAPLAEIFDQISTQTGYDFAFTTDALKDSKPVTINVKNKELNEVLTEVFKGQNLEFTLDNKSVVVKPKEVTILDNVKNYFAAIDIKGLVLDEQNRPIPGATVSVKDGKLNTTTDEHGAFQLAKVQEGATIVITSIGFTKQELPAAKDMGLIQLKVAINELDAVHVIAYGQSTKRYDIGNVTTISSKEIEQQPVGNPILALEGRVPGLFITQNSSLPGSGGITVHIQGQNSINEGNDPLYIIDGVPYVSQMISGLYPNGSSPFNYINPNDIENITVLKDADATAIYGSRAANGAILITTKKGKAGPVKLNANLQNGITMPTFLPDFMNTQQYLQMRLEGKRNDMATISATDYDINGTYDRSRYTDWAKTLIPSHSNYANYNASISGGTANTQYLVSGTFHHETPLIPGDFADNKGAMHFNLNSSTNNQKFRLQFSANYLTDDNRLPGSSIFSPAFTLPPDAPKLYSADGSLNWAQNSNGTSTWINPLAAYTGFYQDKTNNLTSNLTLSYLILPGLELKSSQGYTYMSSNEISTIPFSITKPELRPFGSNGAQYSNGDANSYIIEPQLHYSKQISHGKIDVLLGSTFEQNINNGESFLGSNYISDELLKDIHSAGTLTTGNTIQTIYRYQALYGRLNYNWDGKYIIDLTARRDGSSRFGSENQFHNFGAIGGAWLFSEETFIKNNLPFLSYGKIKGSYGTTGNDQIGDYGYLSLYNSLSTGVLYQGVGGLISGTPVNPYLQWELTKKVQFGFDLGFFKDRILIGANFVHNTSSNELLNYALPTVTGFSGITENFPATVVNSAIEATFSTVNVKSKNFDWRTNFNLTIPKNRVTSFPNIASSSYADGTQGIIIGEPIGVRKVYTYLGVDPATGIYEFKDRNGNPTSSPTPNDQTNLVNLQPKYYGGFENSLRYKRLELNFLIQYVDQLGAGANYLGSSYSFNGPGFKNFNQPLSVLARWQQPGDITPISRFSTIGLPGYQLLSATDVNFSNASYLRLKNISISYLLPQQWIDKIHIQSCRFFLQGQNLLTISPYNGIDPESQSGFLLRTITAGLEFNL